MKTPEVLHDTYFRRLFIPILITILVLSTIVVIIAVPPGTPLAWPTFPIATQKNMLGGFFQNKIIK